MANDKDKTKVKDPRYDIYTTGTNITDTFGGWDDRINNNQETNVEIPREFPKENPYSDRAAIQAAVQQQALNNRLQPNNQEIPDRQRAVFPSNIPPSVGFAVSSNEQEMRNAINGKNGMASPANAPQVSPQVQTPGRNHYADRAAVQAAIENNAAQPVQQQPYNLFAQQKQTGYPNTTTPNAGQRVAGQAGTVHSTPIIDPTVNMDGTNKAKDAVMAARKAGRPVWGDDGTGMLGEYRKTTPITNTDELARAMGYTSPEEEERLRKASLANMRIMAVADAIRHIGNIVHTTNGAPAQKLTSAVQDEYDRYRKGKALRDAANYKYLSYQQQKAAQDQRAKQWEQQFNLNIANAASQDAYRREQARIAGVRAANDKENKDKMYELGVRKADDAKKANEDRLKLQERLGKQRNNIAAGGLALRREEYEYKKNNGYYGNGGARGGKEERRDTRRGYLTKRGATAGEIEATYHQMYEWGKKMKDPRTGKPYIDENALKGQKTYGTYSYGGSSTISQDLKERAVNQMLMEHDDAAVRMHSKYGWDWHEQKPNDKALGIGIGSENEKGKSLGLGL